MRRPIRRYVDGLSAAIPINRQTGHFISIPCSRISPSGTCWKPDQRFLHPDDVLAGPNIDQRQVLAFLVPHLGVERPPLIDRGDRPRIIQRLVHIGVAVVSVVERPAGVQHLPHVAVGIAAARPADQIRLEVAGVRRLQRRGEFHRLDLHVEAGLAGHRLDHLAGLLDIRAVGDRQRHRHRCRHARLLQQRLGLRHVARRHLQVGRRTASWAGWPRPSAYTCPNRRPGSAPRDRSHSSNAWRTSAFFPSVVSCAEPLLVLIEMPV